jgi:hypothetical protein
VCLGIINIRYGPVKSIPKDDNIIARSFISDTCSTTVIIVGLFRLSGHREYSECVYKDCILKVFCLRVKDSIRKRCSVLSQAPSFQRHQMSPSFAFSGSHNT